MSAYEDYDNNEEGLIALITTHLNFFQEQLKRYKKNNQFHEHQLLIEDYLLNAKRDLELLEIRKEMTHGTKQSLRKIG
jgi:hypothetical protein